jgi:hypothetical protein
MIDAMKQALESFEDYQSRMSVEKFDGAITALRQAIAEAEQQPSTSGVIFAVEQAEKKDADEWYEKALWGEKQEPVAWMIDFIDDRFEVKDFVVSSPEHIGAGYNVRPLYTAPPKREIEQEPESWMGVSDNPYCNDADCNDPNGRAMRWHNKRLELRKQAALDGLAETSREIEQEPHPCDNGCQFAKDVGMPEQTCCGDCQYNKAMSTKPENIDTKTGCVDSVDIEPVAYRKEAHGMWFYIENKPSPPNDDYEPLYTSPPKPQNELDAIERAYFAGKEAGIAVGEAETKHFEDLAEYRLKLLMKMPEQKEWVGLTDEKIKVMYNKAIYENTSVSQFVLFRNFALSIEANLKEKNT